jgi:hypothetical protein
MKELGHDDAHSASALFLGPRLTPQSPGCRESRAERQTGASGAKREIAAHSKQCAALGLLQRTLNCASRSDYKTHFRKRVEGWGVGSMCVYCMCMLEIEEGEWVLLALPAASTSRISGQASCTLLASCCNAGEGNTSLSKGPG